MVNFGENLKKMRNAAKMTQQMLADKIGVTKSVISYYELQERSPSPEVLIKLSAVFGVSVDTMLGINKEPIFSVDVSGLEPDDIRLLCELADHLRKKNGK